MQKQKTTQQPICSKYQWIIYDEKDLFLSSIARRIPALRFKFVLVC